MSPPLLDRRALPGVALLAMLGLAACGPSSAPPTPPAASPPAPSATDGMPPTTRPATKDLGIPKDYDCAGTAIEVIYLQYAALLQLDGETVRLGPVAVASGSRYQGWRADGVLVDFWEKGGTAMLNVAGNDYPECLLIESSVPAATDASGTTNAPEDGSATLAPSVLRTYLARGQEPFWLAQVDAAEVRWSTTGHVAPDVFTDVTRSTRADGFDVSAAREGSALALSASDAICRSTMSGMPYPQVVTVRIGGTEYQGCGGDPLELLVGREWTVSSLDGTRIEAPLPTLQFSADGRASGFSGCNRWMAGAALTGEGLRFERPAGTMTACAEAAMAVERAFLTALAKVTRHDFDGDGGLVLFAGDTAMITASPAPVDAGSPGG